MYTLRKSWPPRTDIDDDGSTFTRWSANWEIMEYPGLFLSKGKGTDEHTASWRFTCLAAYLPKHRQTPELHQAILLFRKLDYQRFATRREALQALEAVILS